MNKKILSVSKRIICRLLYGGTLFFLILLLFDIIRFRFHIEIRNLYMILGVSVCFVFSMIIKLNEKIKRILKITIIIFLILSVGLFFCYKNFINNSIYKSFDTNQASVFSNKKVMLIVPHQDDDINVLGGVFEQYVKNNSEVFVVFTTNGDYKKLGKERINEAIECMELCGIDENHVVFLGYGNSSGPKDEAEHLYNSKPGTVVTSCAGFDKTYGTEEHPAYHDGNPYTIDNFISDIHDVILEYKPNVIYCVDQDAQVDHKATSLSFEKAMGQILKSNSDYRPTVLKGFAYGTAWTADNDYYQLNIKSTVNPNDTAGDYIEAATTYKWSERVRIPVDSSLLSRSLYNSKEYKELKTYKTQSAEKRADRVINGDRVFWYRACNSLSYNSMVSVSSGRGDLLNDFMLMDLSDVTGERFPSDGIWIPDSGDDNKCAAFEFNEKKNIQSIYLYDNPSLDDDIIDAEIYVNGEYLKNTGALDRYGAASVVDIQRSDIQSVTIKLIKTNGDYAGLSEVEIYEKEPKLDFDFVKIMDKNQDFAYDYTISDETEELCLYICGAAPRLSKESYNLNIDNKKCSAEIINDKIAVICPKGEECVLEITDATNTYSDKIRIQNKNHNLKIYWLIENWLIEKYLPKSSIAVSVIAVLHRIDSVL